MRRSERGDSLSSAFRRSRHSPLARLVHSASTCERAFLRLQSSSAYGDLREEFREPRNASGRLARMRFAQACRKQCYRSGRWREVVLIFSRSQSIQLLPPRSNIVKLYSPFAISSKSKGHLLSCRYPALKRRQQASAVGPPAEEPAFVFVAFVVFVARAVAGAAESVAGVSVQSAASWPH